MTTLSLQPATGTDDGQWGTGSGYSSSGGTIVLGGYFGTANGWFRTANVTIASGAVISSLTLTCDKQTSAGTAELTLSFVKETNPTYPTSGTDADGRTLTTASHTDTESGTGTYTSTDLSSSGQEVINQGGWSSGNAQMLFVKDNNSNATHGGFENRITVKSYNFGSSIPSIDWTYSTPNTASAALTGTTSSLSSSDTFSAGTKTASAALTGTTSSLSSSDTFSAGTKTASAALTGTTSSLSSSSTFVVTWTASAGLNGLTSLISSSSLSLEPQYISSAALNANTATLASSALFDEGLVFAAVALTGNTLVISSSVTTPVATSNAELSIIPYGLGTEISVGGEVEIRPSHFVGASVSISEASIDPAYDFFGAHIGQGSILFTWKHDNHDLVDRYILYASASLNGTYELVRDFSERRGMLPGMPLGSNIYFRLVSVGKNLAVSSYVQCSQGKIERPVVVLDVTSISGSVIEEGTIFASMDQSTGVVNAVAANERVEIE